MGFLKGFFASAAGVSGLLHSRAITREVTRTLKVARVSLIATAAFLVSLTLCLLIIAVHHLLLIIEMLH